MSWIWGVVAVLVIWAGVTAMRRTAEADPHTRTPARPHAPDNEIDHATLEQAERELRDLDVFQQPEQGFRGDDWGPGTGRYGPPIG